MRHLLQGYQLCATTEGKSPNAIAIVTNSVSYFQGFLISQGISTDVTQISQHELRAFILHLQQKRCFSNHRFNHPQDRGLSGHTINCYLRSIRIFFSWLVPEGIIEANPFDRVKIPRPPRKVIPTFSDSQIQHLLNAIDTKTAEGYRDYTIILTLLDTGMRVSELCNLELKNLWLEEGMVKVLGKGNKERLIPIGKQVQRLLWRYINRYRTEPAANCGFLFLTQEGRPLTKDRVEKIMTYYGRKAGLRGVRCSPHTLRHSAAIRFLRNGGDVWTWTAIDADTKLVPSWFVGLRDAGYAFVFIKDLQSRLANRVQLTTDGHKVYLNVIEDVFGADIDYAMLVKIYGQEPSGEARYSPAKCTGTNSRIITGHPDTAKISTSYVERHNLTMRMHMRRFTRLTNAFSKKLENHMFAIALYFMHYNFARPHKTLANPYPRTPAMAAGVSDHIWTIEEIVSLID